MPLPTDSSDHPGKPVPLQSPRDAQAWAIVYRRRVRERPRDRLLRIAAMAGAMLVHLVFLFGAVLGSAYEPLDLPDSDQTPLLVKLDDQHESPPPPPPPPPLRGLPPKQLGPRHQGSANAAKPSRQPSAATQSSVDSALPPVPTTTPPVITADVQPSSPKVEAIAAPIPPISLPKPAPPPQLAPIPVASEPPPITLATPPTPQPIPPKFQPEPVRPPRPEGNQPMPPPASLALPELPTQNGPQVAPPTIAIASQAPALHATPSVAPIAHAELSAAPPTPELQAVPLPAQPSPSVNLVAPQISPSTPNVPIERPQIQAPSIRVAEAQLEPVPAAPTAPPTIEPPHATAPDATAPKSLAPKIEVSIARPQIESAPAAVPSPASVPPSTPDTSKASSPATASADQHAGHDVSTAPNATPQGSDTAAPGQPNAANSAEGRPNGVPGAPQIYGKDGSINLGQPGQGERGQGTPGAGNPSGPNGTYVQLRPHGDTEIMSHGAPNLGYKHTRFEDDWTPEGESSIDTALRHAVEKTTMKHTFHLPRGVRVECVVMPLFPLALFGCGDGNPPPDPVADQVYERMYLPPTSPLVPPSAATTAAPAAVKLDNSVECANARISGGPLPPSCTSTSTPVPRRPAAASSSSWMPASDQFH